MHGFRQKIIFNIQTIEDIQIFKIETFNISVCVACTAITRVLAVLGVRGPVWHEVGRRTGCQDLCRNPLLVSTQL